MIIELNHLVINLGVGKTPRYRQWTPREREQMRQTNLELNRMFDEFNQRFFEGSLPPYVIMMCNLDRYNVETGGIIGLCHIQTQTILIDASLDGDVLRTTLLHEMIHAKLSNRPRVKHGRAFQSELRRLARMGETWARKEAQHFASTKLARLLNFELAVMELIERQKNGELLTEYDASLVERQLAHRQPVAGAAGDQAQQAQGTGVMW